MTNNPRRRLTRTVAILALYEFDTTDHDLSTIINAYLNMNIVERDVRVVAFLNLTALERGIEFDEDSPPIDTILRKDEMKMFQQIVKGVDDKRTTIDDMITTHAPDWPIKQLAVIDLNILRVAIYEAVYGDVPVSVAINEAVEIAKSFGGDNTPRFVNGVLGSIATVLESDAPVPPNFDDSDTWAS